MTDIARSPAESSGFSKKLAALIIIVYTVFSRPISFKMLFIFW